MTSFSLRSFIMALSPLASSTVASSGKQTEPSSVGVAVGSTRSSGDSVAPSGAGDSVSTASVGTGIGAVDGVATAISVHSNSYSKYLTVPGHGSRSKNSTLTSTGHSGAPSQKFSRNLRTLSFRPQSVLLVDAGPLPQVGTSSLRPNVADVMSINIFSGHRMAKDGSFSQTVLSKSCGGSTVSASTQLYSTSATLTVPGHGSSPPKVSRPMSSMEHEFWAWHISAIMPGAAAEKQLVSWSESSPRPHVSVVSLVRP
mmetsp:Transcript_54243/g.132953  ORF Transcript_54243/g.132953 Transcript_54243/m.132953 type:complete len:256 (+) Transcript_54243:629-1396(+)